MNLSKPKSEEAAFYALIEKRDSGKKENKLDMEAG